MSGMFIPSWFIWLLTYWWVVLLVICTAGIYGLLLLWKKWRKS